MEWKRHSIEDIESPFPTSRNARYSAVLESHEDHPDDPLLVRWDVYRNGVHVGAGRLLRVRSSASHYGLTLESVRGEHVPPREVCEAAIDAARSHGLLDAPRVSVSRNALAVRFGPRW